MIDLKTTYMGLVLKNPIIAASSGMTDTIEKVKALYNEGVGAIVLKSIFEEQILREIDSLTINNMYGNYADADNYVSFYTKEHNVNEYLKLIENSKKETDIPIIASVNCISSSEWVDFAKKIQDAGADAIELNMFILPANENMLGSEIENVYFDIINKIKKHISIPVAVKLSSYFSGMANFMVKLSNSGIGSLILFNHFHRPDIDIDKEELTSTHIFSTPADNAQSLRWAAILSGKIGCDIATSTGIHTGADVVKNILVGADAVQIASTLYKNSPKYIGQMLTDLKNWMESKKYTKITDFKSKLSAKNIKNPMMFERAQFMKYYSNHI